MSRRTVQQMIAEVQRMPGLARVGVGEIMDKLNTVHKDITNYPWPFNYGDTNVNVPAPYTTGTISITDGTAAVTGAGTTWDPLWLNRRIQFGSSNLDYIVSGITGAGTLTLAQVVNLGANAVNVTYTLYQDTFQYPDDYLVGSDVSLMHPTVRYRINKIPRYRFEQYMNAGMRSFFTSIQQFYCDEGQNATTGRYQFRLGPPPGGVVTYRLTYHKVAVDLTLPTQQTMLPDSFDEIITLGAASKLYDIYKMPGESLGAKMLADGKLRLLKRQYATATIDDVPDAAMELPDSSISQWGLSIERMP
jgi:hypothetical protein